MHHYGHLIRVLHCCTSQAVTEALAATDLTDSQGRIIGFLASRNSPACPRDIEETFHLSHATVSGILSRLEKKQFIELHTDPEDRRCKRISILPKGWAFAERVHGEILKNEERIVRGFSEDEQAQFADLLTRAARNMGADPMCIVIKEESDE